MAKNEIPLGYPIMEKLLETEDFSKINKTMTASYETLERLLKGKSGGLQKQKKVRQALKAYDLTLDLLQELLKAKYANVEKLKQNK